MNEMSRKPAPGLFRSVNLIEEIVVDPELIGAQQPFPDMEQFVFEQAIGVDVGQQAGHGCLQVLDQGQPPSLAPARGHSRPPRRASMGPPQTKESLMRYLLPVDGSAALERVRAAGGIPTRTHFARALVTLGAAADEDAAFDRWLGRGRPAHVKAAWPELSQAVGWIEIGRAHV